MGVDCATGQIVWQTPNPDSLKMSHSSLVPMTIAGKKMYVYNALGGLMRRFGRGKRQRQAFMEG